MKKLSKLLSIILCLCVVLTLTACSNNKADSDTSLNATEIYNSASQKLEALTSFKSKTSMRTQVIGDGTEINFSVESDVKVQKTADNAKMEITSTTELPDSDPVETKMIFADSYIYMEAADQKLKAKTDFLTAQNIMGNSASGTSLPETEGITDITASKEGSNTVLTVTIDTETFNNMFIDELSSIAANANSINVSKIDAIVTVNGDGYISKVSYSCSLEYTIDNATQTINMWIDATYSDFDEDMNITAPQKTDDYLEIDASLLNGATA